MLRDMMKIWTPDIEQRLEQEIQRRTFGRVRHVQVQMDEDQVVVRGVTSSYYVVQLAVLAVREVLPSTPVVLDIEVGAGTRSRRHSTERPLARV